MTENVRKDNQLPMDLRANATHDLILHELHPWNNCRVAYVSHAIFLITIVFNANPSTHPQATRLLDRINNQLINPLSSDEMLTAYKVTLERVNTELAEKAKKVDL